MHELSENPSESSSARVSRHAGKDPPLSKDDLQLLKGLQDSVIHLLAEKKIDTNVFSPPGEVASRPLKPNEQNVKNRAREKKFNAHIQKYDPCSTYSIISISFSFHHRMKLEQEAWSEVGSFYKPMLSEVEKREKEMLAGSGKGKQRATLEEIARWDVDERDIPERFCGPKGIKLALDIVGAVPDTSGPLEKRLQGLEFIVSSLQLNYRFMYTDALGSSLDGSPS